MNGMVVAMIVTNWTLVSSGRLGHVDDVDADVRGVERRLGAHGAVGLPGAGG